MGEEVEASLSIMRAMQEEHKSNLQKLSAKFDQVMKDAEFNKDRVSSVADTAKSMQTSLTISSTTCQSMNSFVGRICNKRQPTRRSGAGGAMSRVRATKF